MVRICGVADKAVRERWAVAEGGVDKKVKKIYCIYKKLCIFVH